MKSIRIANLKRLAALRGLDGPTELGAVIGRHPAQASNLLNGIASFGEKIARSIEEQANLPQGWLDIDHSAKSENLDSVKISDIIPGSKMNAVANHPTIKRVRFSVLNGVPGFSVESLSSEEKPAILPASDWASRRGYKINQLYALGVDDESMAPALFVGDTVIVNTADTTPSDGVVFLINYEGAAVLRRLIRDEGQWWLMADNEDQRRYMRKRQHEGVFLIGRVVQKLSDRI